MIVFFLFIFMLLSSVIVYILKYKQYYKEYSIVDAKAYPMKALLPIGLALLDKLGCTYKSSYSRKTLLKLTELYGGSKADFYLRINTANKISTVLLIIVIVLFFGSVLQLQNTQSRPTVSYIEQGRLRRPSFGSGDKYIEIQAHIQAEYNEETQNFRIQLKEMNPQNDSQAVEKAYRLLTQDLIRGNNSNLSNVRDPLVLKESYEVFCDGDIKVQWESNDVSTIRNDGTIILPEKGQAYKTVIVTALIKKNSAELTKYFTITLCPKELSLEEQKMNNAKVELQRALEKSLSSENNTIELPTNLENDDSVRIYWSDGSDEEKPQKKQSAIGYIVFALLAGIVAFVLMERETARQVEQRRKMIKYEFPVFLTKLLLLVNAGMNVTNAWERIVQENHEDTYLNKELKKAILEIRGGMPETKAYERFAQRCRLPEISKFVSILLQNLRKGNSEFVALLRIQSTECWETRKNMAKKLGEEASTKLLLPMMLMLIGILIIVAAPAILAMKGF